MYYYQITRPEADKSEGGGARVWERESRCDPRAGRRSDLGRPARAGVGARGSHGRPEAIRVRDLWRPARAGAGARGLRCDPRAGRQGDPRADEEEEEEQPGPQAHKKAVPPPLTLRTSSYDHCILYHYHIIIWICNPYFRTPPHGLFSAGRSFLPNCVHFYCQQCQQKAGDPSPPVPTMHS